MKYCLIIKTSSLGDVIHTLPAITEASQNIKNLQFDWVVEKSFAEVPSWHPAVNKTIVIEIRKWRKNIIRHIKNIIIFRKTLRTRKYDYIIDAQGLIKSGVITFFSKGIKYGLDKKSAKESLASFFYNKKIHIKKNQHAVLRIKELFSKVFDYQTKTVVNYGLSFSNWKYNDSKKYVVFLHGTTWPTKYWSFESWKILAKEFIKQGLSILIPWGNEDEYARAVELSENVKNITVLPKMNLFQFDIFGCTTKTLGSIAAATCSL